MADKPSHRAFMAENYESGDDKKTKYTKIGAAWPVKDGKGLKLHLKAFPTDGVVMLFPNKPKPTD